MESWIKLGKGARLTKADYALRIQWTVKNRQTLVVALSPIFFLPPQSINIHNFKLDTSMHRIKNVFASFS